MGILEGVLLVIGAALLVAGCRKNGRGMMLAAALMLLCSGHMGDVARGVVDGYTNAGAHRL